jgi:hypothetical protein
MNQLIEVLKHDEFFSPLAFIFFGCATLLMAWTQGSRVSRVPPFEPWLEKIGARMAERQGLSWILIGFGLLWTLQLGLDRFLQP